MTKRRGMLTCLVGLVLLGVGLGSGAMAALGNRGTPPGAIVYEDAGKFFVTLRSLEHPFEPSGPQEMPKEAYARYWSWTFAAWGMTACCAASLLIALIWVFRLDWRRKDAA